jgi:4-hydroxymandelate oxidase
VDTSTTLLGVRVDSPVLVAPSAFHRFAHPQGEAATAAAAAARNVVYCYNWMLAHVPFEEVKDTGGPKWLHLYVTKVRARARAPRPQHGGSASALETGQRSVP